MAYWELVTITEPIARKAYLCEACQCVNHLSKRDVTAEEWATIQKAREEGCKILPGTSYIKIKGKYDGDFITFRARPEIDDIAQKYDCYED